MQTGSHPVRGGGEACIVHPLFVFLDHLFEEEGGPTILVEEETPTEEVEVVSLASLATNNNNKNRPW